MLWQTLKMNACFALVALCLQNNALAQLAEIQQPGALQPIVINFNDHETNTVNSLNSYWNASSTRQDNDPVSNEQDLEPSLGEELLDDENNDENDYLTDDDVDSEELPPREPSLVDWPNSTIQAIVLDPREHNPKSPVDQSSRLIEKFSRDWSGFVSCEKVYMWEAPNIRYQPLYFGRRHRRALWACRSG